MLACCARALRNAPSLEILIGCDAASRWKVAQRKLAAKIPSQAQPRCNARLSISVRGALLDVVTVTAAKRFATDATQSPQIRCTGTTKTGPGSQGMTDQ